MTIIETPTLEQIKEYFQSAKEVKFVCSGLILDITNCEIIKYGNTYQARLDGTIQTGASYHCLYAEDGKYAEIISYKDLEITDWRSERESYDYINPNHYKSFSKEVIDMMVDIWGAEAVAIHCEITAFKYRMRLGNKPDQPIERDLEKAKWYEAKAKELKSKIQ